MENDNLVLRGIEDTFDIFFEIFNQQSWTHDMRVIEWQQFLEKFNTALD